MTNKKNKDQTLNLIADNSSLDEEWNFETEVIKDKKNYRALELAKSFLPSSQRWQRGKKFEEGYFTLRAFESPKLLTASPEGLELKGNKELNHY